MQRLSGRATQPVHREAEQNRRLSGQEIITRGLAGYGRIPPDALVIVVPQSTASQIADQRKAPLGQLNGQAVRGAVKELWFPANFVGRNLRVTKPDKQNTEVAIAGEKDRAAAAVEDNDQAGIYRLSLPAGGEKDSGAPQIYAVNAPFLESRLEEISAAELAAKLKPIRTEVLDVSALKQGGKRVDLALPLLGLLIITLLLEGWLGQRF